MRAVNLLPEQYRRRTPTGRAGGAYIVLGVLLAILVGTALYILANNKVNDRRDELVKVQNETRAAQAEAASLAAFGTFAEVKQTRVSSVRSLAGQRFDFERLFRELAHVMPRGAWVASLEAAAKPAEAADPTAAAAGGPTLHLTGCAPSPSAVATVLVRLRKLHRATDVRLASSSRGASSTAGGTATACGTTRNRANYSFDLNVDFTATPTRSDLVATDKVPASLGGGQ